MAMTDSRPLDPNEVNTDGSDDGPKAKRHKTVPAPTQEEESAETKALRQLVRELTQQNGELTQQNGELTQQNGELTQQNAQLAEKDRNRDKIAKKRSLRSLLLLSEGDIKTKRRGTDFSHVKGTREKASAQEAEFKLFNPDPEKIELDSVSRVLLHQINKSATGHPDSILVDFQYASEADIVTLVRDALVDAIAILGYLGVDIESMEVFLERSMFSGRPDVVAVRSSRHRLPLLVIEVKRPSVTGSLTDEAKVLGQGYDYVELQRAFGLRLSSVVLTTVEETCVCWNKDDTETKGRYVKDCALLLGSAKTPRNQTVSTPTDSKQLSVSPPELVPAESLDDAEIEIEFVKDQERVLERSKVFKSHDLVKVLCTVLVHATGTTQKSKGKIDELETGKKYLFERALRFTETSYHWGSLVASLGQEIPSRAYKKSLKQRKAQKRSAVDCSDKDAYYCIGRLGQGGTSNVWHALDAEGNEVAIKMYVKGTDEEDKPLDETGFTELAESRTKMEVLRLNEFYNLEPKAKHLKLAGHHCVVMPLFTPVKSEDRGDTLAEVKSVLEKFQIRKLKYDDNDVRWRHIGTYKEKFILYDLADLKDSDDGDSFVDHHVKILKERIKFESEGKREEFTRKESQPRIALAPAET